MAAGPNGRRCKRRSRVTYARADSWQAGKQPTAAGPEASLPLDASVLSIILPILGALISMGCAVNGAPTWAAKRLLISRAGC